MQYRLFAAAAILVVIASVLIITGGLRTNAQTVSPEPVIAMASVQRFQYGNMFWRGDTKTIYVLYDPLPGQCRGTVETYPDTWNVSIPEYDPAYEPTEPGYVQPQRGFGYLWRNNYDLRVKLGYGLFHEAGYTMLFHQNGNKSWFSGGNNDVYIIEGNQWQRYDLRAFDVCANPQYQPGQNPPPLQSPTAVVPTPG